MVTLYYDGECSWCRTSARRLKRWDWCNRLQMIDYSTLEADARPVDSTVFQSGIPVQTYLGTILIGFPGMRHAIMRTPIGWACGWVLYVPGIANLGQRIYANLARRRKLQSNQCPPR